MKGYPAEIDLGGATYAVEHVLTPLDASADGRSTLAREMRRQGVAEALVLANESGTFVVPVEADGGLDPARLVQVGR